MDHPLDATWDDFSPEPEVTPVDLDLFRQDLVSYPPGGVSNRPPRNAI